MGNVQREIGMQNKWLFDPGFPSSDLDLCWWDPEHEVQTKGGERMSKGNLFGTCLE